MLSLHSIRKVLIVTLVCATINWSSASPVSDAESTLDLIILHNNDIHARFEQTDKYSATCSPDEMVNNQCYGGIARVSELVKRYRKEAEEGGPHVLYLNAGDTYTGTPWFSIFKDKIVADFLNILKPDAISLGNHELDLGVEGLLPLLNEVDFPVLVANLNISTSHPLWKTKSLKKSVVFDIKGQKVGVIGYLTPETKDVTVTNDLEFLPEVVAINEEAQTLKNRGINIVLALGHSGYEVDKDIAKNCPLVDAVVGGHSNTFLYTGEQPDVEQIDGPYPTIITQASGKQVPVVQAYAFTKYLGELRLTFDKQGNLLHSGGQSILLNGTYARDPEVLALLDKYRPSVVKLMQNEIGSTKVVLEQSQCRAAECNIGNMIADAFVNARVLSYDGQYWTDASIAFIQGGGVRASIHAGTITQFDLDQVLPFNDMLILVKMPGSILKQALEHSVARYTGDRGEFLQMSGVKVVYDLTKSAGERVQSVQVRCAECDVPQFEDLDPKRTYGVILAQFLYSGGDGFNMFKGLPYEDLQLMDIDAVNKYLSSQGPVYAVVEGRITIHGKPIIEPNQPTGSASSIVKNNICIIFTAIAFVYLHL